MDIQTEDIEVFLAVVRERSFGRAATALLVSQPAVSERMARLERSTGAPLFFRSSRGTTLTPAGAAFLPYAERTAALLADAVSAVHALDAAPRLRIAVHTTFAHRAVPLALGATAGLQRSVKVRDAHSDAIVAMLVDGACDVGFIVPGARPRPLHFAALPPDPVTPVVAPSHPLAGRTVADAELAGHPIAFTRFGAGAEQFVDRLDAAAIPEWSWTECSDAVTALHLAQQFAYVAFVTQSLAEAHVAMGTVARCRLRPAVRWDIPLTLATRSSDRDDPAIAAIRAAVAALPRAAGARRGRSAA
jgi:DNA-binding transcriptional LysR family regulator